jgi:predicted AlkP superfamily pyrophosphatase or phosphodiesterase
MRGLVKCLAVLALLLPLAAHAAEPAPLILISIDGFRADYFNRGETPTLAMLAKDGVRSTAMHPAFPSLTYPNHYTLVTGLWPDHHGVIGNKMWDPAVSLEPFTMAAKSAEDPRWWEGATPIWVTAQKAGRVVAAAGWPGTEGLVHGIRANYLDPWRDHRKPQEIAAIALNWFDLPAGLKPSVELLYMDDVDHAGHDYGPQTPEMAAALRGVDAALATLVTGLKQRGLFDRTNIVLVSDHGMADTSHARSVVLDDLLDVAHVRVIDVGAAMGIDPLPGHDGDVAKALLKPLPHATCWRKSRIPARLHYGTNPRVPDFVCMAEIGWLMETRADMAKWTKPLWGEHGYDPADPHMNALFLAHGPAFRPGVTLAPFDNVDVYSLLMKITALAPEKNDGNLSTFSPALK